MNRELFVKTILELHKLLKVFGKLENVLDCYSPSLYEPVDAIVDSMLDDIIGSTKYNISDKALETIYNDDNKDNLLALFDRLSSKDEDYVEL